MVPRPPFRRRDAVSRQSIANGRVYETVRFAMADKSLGLFDFWRPDMKRFREDPRFAGLVRRIWLEYYWRQWGWADACAPAGESLYCE